MPPIDPAALPPVPARLRGASAAAGLVLEMAASSVSPIDAKGSGVAGATGAFGACACPGEGNDPEPDPGWTGGRCCGIGDAKGFV